jgi:hypothetical protein
LKFDIKTLFNLNEIMNLKNICFGLAGIIIGHIGLFAQEKPGYYVDREGKLYWNKDLPVYINIASDTISKGITLNSQNQAKYSNPLYLDTEGINWIRTRYAVDPETRKIVTPQVEVKFEVYADGLKPLTSIDLDEAPTFFADGNRFYGKGLSVSLNSIDEGSGVKKLIYSLNKSDPVPYKNSFPIEKEGEHKLSYWAADFVGNQEEEKSKSFIVDVSAPNTYHNINGISDDNIISTSSRIYFTLEDNLSGIAKTYYRIDDGNQILYNGLQIPVGKLSDGDHTVYYYSVDNVENKETEKSFSFYFDNMAPLTAAAVLGDRFIIEGKVYFSGRSKLKLTAVDNKSGVKEIRFSIDGEDFEIYDQPLYLPAVAGNHTVRFYSIDNASNTAENGNESFKHNVSKVYVDLIGPNIDYKLSGKSRAIGDTVYIGPLTKIVLSGVDTESGMDYISYSLDGNQEEIKYEGVFSVSDSGYHKLDIFGYDNVHNRNIATRYFFVDNQAPEIVETFSVSPFDEKKGLDVYPSNASLFLAATDNLIGLEKITYQIKGEAEKLYIGMITGLKSRSNYEITIKAYDVLGNVSEKKIEFYTSK